MFQSIIVKRDLDATTHCTPAEQRPRSVVAPSSSSSLFSRVCFGEHSSVLTNLDQRGAVIREERLKNSNYVSSLVDTRSVMSAHATASTRAVLDLLHSCLLSKDTQRELYALLGESPSPKTSYFSLKSDIRD